MSFKESRRNGLLVLLLGILLLSGVGARAAVLLPDTLIQNQARATYFDNTRQHNVLVVSNIAALRVQVQRSILLTQDQAVPGAPGGWVYLPHRLQNTGNVIDAYDISVTIPAGGSITLDQISVYHDINGNGQPDSGEPLMSRTARLTPGALTHLVIVAHVPAQAGDGSNALLQVQAQSVDQPQVSASNDDTVNITAGSLLRITKSSDHVCEVPVAPSSTIRYSLLMRNLGADLSNSRTITLDGGARDGLLLEDEIPANTTLLTSPAPVSTGPVQGIVVVELAAGGWLSLANWNGSDLIRSIGLFIPSDQLVFRRNFSATLDFTVQVADAITPGTWLWNQALVDSDGNGSSDFVSNKVCNTLEPLGPGGNANQATLTFLETTNDYRSACGADPSTCTQPAYNGDAFEPAGSYRTDDTAGYTLFRDGIYLQVDSTSLNTAAYRVDEIFGGNAILVRVESKGTGDYLMVAMRETAANSGEFRSLYPVRLSTTDRGGGGLCSDQTPSDCVLLSEPDDSLQASITDPGTDELLVDAAVVDPLGVVFDSVTRRPVAGAVVSLHNADGSLALDPDTGGVSVLAPQTTGSAGTYQFPRIYPGTYYLNVQPPGGYNFPSAMAKDRFAGAYEVNDYSYGQDGFSASAGSGQFTLAAGDPPLIVDIPLDPDQYSDLTLEKSTPVSRAAVGDFVPYTLRFRNSSDAQGGSGTILPTVHVIDQLPTGFAYVKGTARLDGTPIPDPSGGVGPKLDFTLSNVPTGQDYTFTYLLRLSAGAVDGDGINIAQASAVLGDLTLLSNPARAKVEVRREPILSDQAYLFGKVYVDSDCDERQKPGEWPVAGVRLYLEDGTFVVTDAEGMYSLYGLRPGTHVVKVDPTTLPKGLQLVPLEQPQAGDPESRFVELSNSDWHRADFFARCTGEDPQALHDELKRRRLRARGPWMLDEALKTAELAQNPRTVSDRDREVASADGDISASVSERPSAKQGGAASAAGALGAGAAALVSGGSGPQRQAGNGTGGGTRSTAPATPEPWQDVKGVAEQVTTAMAKAGTWLWPQGQVSRDGRLVVVVRSGLDPQLYVNGKQLGPDHLGERILNRRERAEVLAWYGLPLRVGVNQVEVRAVDPFGNARVLAKRAVVRPGNGARLRIIPAHDSIPADGSSVLAVRVQVLDANGVPASGVHFLTLEASDGAWREPDLQDRNRGHQVRVDGGEGVFHLLSSQRDGTVTLRVFQGDGEGEGQQAEAQVRFTAPQRPLVASGFLELSASRDWSSSDAPGSLLSSDRWNMDGQSAFFVKGTVKHGYLLTMSYDNKKDGENLFRDLDPGAYYPIYGDAAAKGYEAQSRSKLYMRLEKDRNSVMWGDFRTDHDVEDSLTRQRRALTGLNLNLEQGRHHLRAYAAQSNTRQLDEQIRGNGTATNYRIANAPAQTNSEIIELITYDRDNTGRVVSRQSLNRFSDYYFDPFDGSIQFLQPVPSQDENGNPVYVHISYDAAGQGKDYMVGGVRGDYQLTDNLSVGASAAFSEHSTDGYRLLGVNSHLSLGEGRWVEAEVADMSHKDGTADGSAYRVEAQQQWPEQDATLSLKWGRAQTGFDNPDATIAAGREEGSVEMSKGLSERTRLKGELMNSRGIDTGDERRSAELAVNHKGGTWELEGGLRYTQQRNTADNADFTSGRVKGSKSFSFASYDGEASAEYEQDLSNSARNRLQLGAELQVEAKTKVYGRYELSSSLDGVTAMSSNVRQSTTKVGVESAWLPSTNVYSEFRRQGGIQGDDVESASGVRGSYEWRPGIHVSPAFEYVNAIKGGSGDSVALSLGLKDERSPYRKGSFRVDLRRGDASDYRAFMGGYAARMNADWSGVTRLDYKDEDPDVGNRRLSEVLTLGLARRPQYDNRYHALGMLRLKRETNYNDIPERTAWILSSHHNLRLGTGRYLSGRLANKWETQSYQGQDYRSTTQLLDARLLWQLGRRWELDLRGGVLGTDGGRSLRQAYGAGINYLMRRNLRLGAAYNIIGFRDEDLDPDGYNAQGVKVSLQLKFDEDVFQWLND